MKNSDRSKAILEGFVYWYTHKDEAEAKAEGDHPDLHVLTALEFYNKIESYIEEDHVDGRGSMEDHIVTYGVESSFKTEDEDKEFFEQVVVVADFGECEGTQTVVSLTDPFNNLEAVKQLLEFIANPYGKKM